MLKNKIWLGIVLSIILILSFTTSFAVYYKFTEESGAGFYMSEDDHCDALENWNEQRQIMQDLGTLLGHSKLDGTYPKDGITGGYLGRLNYGLDASKPAVPVVNDMYLATDTTKVYKCFVAGNWVQVYPITEVDPTVDTDAKIKAILVDEVTKTGTFTAGKIAKINNASGIIEEGTNTDADVADAVTKKHTSGSETLAGDVSGTVGANTIDKIKGHTVDETAIANDKILVYKTTGDKYVYEIRDLSLYYLKTEIDTLSEVETIYTKDIIDSDELAALKFTNLDDTPANYTDQAGKYVKVNAGETALEFGTPTGGAGTYLELTDTPAAYDNGKYAKSTADGVVWDTPAGAGTVTTSGTPEVNDIARFTGATVIEGLTYDELITALNLNSDDLSDVASIAMLDENEDVAGDWTVSGTFATVDATEFTYLEGVTEEIQTALDTIIGKNYYSALGSDNTYSDNADVDSQPVGESVTFGDLLYFNWTDKEWKKAKADAFATTPAERIALESKADSETCLMLVKGYIRDDDAFDFGAARVFLNDDTAGTCSSTAPEESGDQIQMVGTAKSADILFFNPSQDVGEI